MPSDLTMDCCYYQREGKLIGPISVEVMQRLLDAEVNHSWHGVGEDEPGNGAF